MLTILFALVGYLAVGFFVGVWFRSEAPRYDTMRDVDVAICAKITILVWPLVFLLVAIFKLSDKLEVWQADLAEKLFSDRKKNKATPQ